MRAGQGKVRLARRAPLLYVRSFRETVNNRLVKIEAFSSSNVPIYKAGSGLVEMDKKRLKPYELFEREDDWSSCTYFYLDKPENRLPG